MILVIDKSKKAARNLADMLFYMGFLAKAATPAEALCEISTLYRSVILTSPALLPDTKDYVSRLRSYVPDVPVFAISAVGSPLSELFDRVFEQGAFAAGIAEGVIDYCDGRGLLIPGHYALAGLDVSADLKQPTYFNEALPFTKTECMILRYLVRAYPTPMNAAKILNHSYRPSRMPDVANIRTHISIINKKFRQITGRALIQQSFGEGYRMITTYPEELEDTERITAKKL